MDWRDWKGSWAVVTGASSGIGREFAVRLAKRGLNLVLVARREPLLRELGAKLQADHAVKVRVEPRDLAAPGAAAALRERLAEPGIKPRLLCNCAAFGRWGRFEATPLPDYERMLALNAGALIGMCHAFLPDLTSHPDSAIVNVSSPAAFQPIPYLAVYAASKAFVHHFSQALYGEWRACGVHVQTLVPGPTDTEFDRIAGAYESAVKKRGSVVEVVARSLRELERETPVANAATGVWRQRAFAGLAPPKLVIRLVGRMFRPPDGDPPRPR
jgi:hypothetical protein